MNNNGGFKDGAGCWLSALLVVAISKRILITGGDGFLGYRLAKRMNQGTRYQTKSTLRRSCIGFPFSSVTVGEIDKRTDWFSALRGQDIVIHTAARVHVIRESASTSLGLYRKVNVDGTLNLARQSAAAGVKRFVFISSIKVNGEQTAPGQTFQLENEARPIDSYGISKWEAEQGLQKIAKETGMEVVIIRPPLVYGPGVKGNFANLIKLVRTGLPLPLGAIYNRRSMIALDNLVDLIITWIDHPNAANQIFLVSDGQDLSTTELLQGLAKAMARPARLFRMPGALLSFTATVLGKKSVGDRLLGSLQVDISKTSTLLSWTPPISVEEGLRRCIEIRGFRL